MKASLVAVGVVLIVVGLLLAAIGMMPSIIGQKPTTSNLLATNSYSITKGHELSVGVALNSGQTLEGTFSQANSSVLFYVMTSVQQNYFGNCAPCKAPSLLNASNSGSYTYQIPINASGTYYLVMDGTGAKIRQTVQLTAQAADPLTTNYGYLIPGIAVVLIGIIPIGFGAVSGKSTHPTESKPPA